MGVLILLCTFVVSVVAFLVCAMAFRMCVCVCVCVCVCMCVCVLSLSLSLSLSPAYFAIIALCETEGTWGEGCTFLLLICLLDLVIMFSQLLCFSTLSIPSGRAQTGVQALCIKFNA